MFSTGRMFIICDDHEALTATSDAQWLTEHRGLLILFWLCHLSALILFQSVLIALLGRRFIDYYLRLRFGSHSEVYVIKGSSQNALHLGENIATHDNPRQGRDGKRLVIFLSGDEDAVQKTRGKASRFGGIVQPLDRCHDLLYYMKKVGLGRWGKRDTKNRIVDISFHMLQTILGRWFRKNTEYHIILMPDASSASEDVLRVVAYAKEKGVSPDCLDIFAIMASDWNRKEMESISQQREGEGERRVYPYTFHLVSEVELSARQMVKKHPPFKCPAFHFDAKGTTMHNFTVMILGFGETGQHALLRLIMNSQFVGSSMHATIIDKDADRLYDSFKHRYPGLKLCCEITPKPFDVPCEFLYEHLKATNDLDYVVIALGCEKTNKRLAQDIRLHYERTGLNKMPFIAIAASGDGSKECKPEENTFYFGRPEDLYQESLIIREEIDDMAKAVNDVYNDLNPNGKKSWQELDWFTQESNRAAADFIPAMLMLANLDENDVVDKEILTEDSVLAEILAETEHLRWNAFYATMGYSPMSLEEVQQRFESCEKKPRDGTVAKQHVCLVAWDDLDRINDAYREFAAKANYTDELKRNFKENDRVIIKNIPEFLRTVKGGE
jgi:hypothetical protein